MFNNLKELREAALEVCHSNKEHTFCSKNEVIGFIIDETMYVVPWSHSAIRILSQESFKRDNLIIPTGTDLVPKEKEEYWELLEKAAYEESSM